MGFNRTCMDGDQWLRISLPMQETRVRSLAWEDPTCCGATKARASPLLGLCSRAGALRQEEPSQGEATQHNSRVAPTPRTWRKAPAATEARGAPKYIHTYVKQKTIQTKGHHPAMLPVPTLVPLLTTNSLLSF